MGITGDKTKPQSAMIYTVTEVHIVPGTNEMTVVAISDDGEVKKTHVTVDIQNKIDNINDALLNQINGFFNTVVADALEIGDSQVDGELFSKSSSGV